MLTPFEFNYFRAVGWKSATVARIPGGWVVFCANCELQHDISTEQDPDFNAAMSWISQHNSSALHLVADRLF